MKEFEYVVRDKIGLHARPAGILVKTAKEFGCDVQITFKDKTVSAKGILGIMGLGVTSGDKLKFSFNGVDEDIALKKIQDLCYEVI